MSSFSDLKFVKSWGVGLCAPLFCHCGDLFSRSAKGTLQCFLCFSSARLKDLGVNFKVFILFHYYYLRQSGVSFCTFVYSVCCLSWMRRRVPKWTRIQLCWGKYRKRDQLIIWYSWPVNGKCFGFNCHFAHKHISSVEVWVCSIDEESGYNELWNFWTWTQADRRVCDPHGCSGQYFSLDPRP